MSHSPNGSHPAQSISRHILVVLAIAIFLTAMGLIILQNVLGPGAPKILQSYDHGYAEGYADARAQLSPLADDDFPLKTITANVLAVSGNTLQVEAMGLYMDERADGVGNKRTVTVEEDATITVQTRISDEEYARQLRAWNPQGDGLPPVPFTEEEGSLEDIQVGDVVALFATDDADLRMQKSFRVNAVTVIAAPQIDPLVLPEAPAAAQ